VAAGQCEGLVTLTFHHCTLNDAAAVALGVALELQTHQFAEARVYRSRNFYGVLTIFKQHDNERNLDYLVLWHGRTMHGMQFLNPQQAAWPSLYYSEKSGVGLAMHALPAGHRRIGLVGLGVGTLATYAQVEDYVHIYEINPEVQRLATSWFTYLTNCPAKVETTLGDARLSLEREPPQDFDLLALDAFNSDAIPVHLLTKEAFVIYERHLKTNGVIAVHVSNKSVNLEPVVINLARHFNYKVATIDCTPPADKPWILGSVWMLLSRNAEFVNSPTIRVAARPAGQPQAHRRPGESPPATGRWRRRCGDRRRRPASPPRSSALPPGPRRRTASAGRARRRRQTRPPRRPAAGGPAAAG